MKTKHILLAATTMFGFALHAQDVHFSQLTETPLLINPAQAGLSHSFLAIINYKDQWRSVSSIPYKTFNVSGDLAFLKKPNGNHMGIGIDVFSDKAGDGNMSTTTGTLSLSGVLAADDHNLISAGLSGGFGQRSLDVSKLQWDNQYIGGHYDASASSLEQTVANHNYADFSAGLAWFYGTGHATLSSNDAKMFNLGISLQHINKPLYSFYADEAQHLPMKYMIYGNGDFGIKNYNLVLEPSYLVMIEGGHREIIAGMMFKYITQESSHYTGRKKQNAFVLGSYYRFSDAICIAARYEFSNWSIGTSYDANISSLKAATNVRGGFEFSLRFMSPNPFGVGTTSRLFD